MSVRDVSTEALRQEALGELHRLLFLADRRQNLEALARKLGCQVAATRSLLEELAAKLDEVCWGTQLRQVMPDVWRLEAKPDPSGRTETKKLSAAALEVLAIVATHQPISTQAISDVRGAESYGAVELLVTRKLLAASESPSSAVNGRAKRWRVTQRFFDLFGFRNLEHYLAEADVDAVLRGERALVEE